jgi:nitrate reductase NapE component
MSSAAGQAATSVAGNWLDDLANAAARGAGSILEWAVTFWVHVPTQDVAGPGSVASWLSGKLLWPTCFAAVLGVLFAAGRIALSGARPAVDLASGLVRLAVVTAVGLPVIAAATVGGDGFSTWIVGQADPGGVGHGFFDLSSVSGAFGPVVLLLVACVGIVIGLLQILLMLVRSGMLIILAAVLPTLAACAINPSGVHAYRRALNWTVAALLYKPLAAVIYAAAFKGMSPPSAAEHMSATSAAQRQITGVLVLALALLAMPAVMRLVTPAIAHLGGGSGLPAGAIPGMRVPSGAVRAPRAAMRPTSFAGAAAGGGAMAVVGAAGAAHRSASRYAHWAIDAAAGPVEGHGGSAPPTGRPPTGASGAGSRPGPKPGQPPRGPSGTTDRGA